VVQPGPFRRGAATGAIVGVPVGLAIIGVVSMISAIKGKFLGALI
jgi:hypothetical protein